MYNCIGFTSLCLKSQQYYASSCSGVNCHSATVAACLCVVCFAHVFSPPPAPSVGVGGCSSSCSSWVAHLRGINSSPTAYSYLVFQSLHVTSLLHSIHSDFMVLQLRLFCILALPPSGSQSVAQSTPASGSQSVAAQSTSASGSLSAIPVAPGPVEICQCFYTGGPVDSWQWLPVGNPNNTGFCHWLHFINPADSCQWSSVGFKADSFQRSSISSQADCCQWSFVGAQADRCQCLFVNSLADSSQWSSVGGPAKVQEGFPVGGWASRMSQPLSFPLASRGSQPSSSSLASRGPLPPPPAPEGSWPSPPVPASSGSKPTNLWPVSRGLPLLPMVSASTCSGLPPSLTASASTSRSLPPSHSASNSTHRGLPSRLACSATTPHPDLLVSLWADFGHPQDPPPPRDFIWSLFCLVHCWIWNIWKLLLEEGVLSVLLWQPVCVFDVLPFPPLAPSPAHLCVYLWPWQQLHTWEGWSHHSLPISTWSLEHFGARLLNSIQLLHGAAT